MFSQTKKIIFLVNNESSSQNNGVNQDRKGEAHIIMKNIKCEEHMAHGESDSYYGLVSLKTATYYELGSSDGCYLYTRWNNHMTCHKEWLLNFDGLKEI